ncbi:MAG: gamma-glutamylcyclotransferase [Saprospiraceae bacterium]|nr:gamma-glutamylcyclotransferase [Saprospiraceae bacterium]
MQSSLFTYGTLMVPEIIQALLGRQPQAKPATLDGFRRYLLLDANYPGIKTQVDNRVSGLIYYQLSQNDLDILNDFEGEPYELKPVSATLISGEGVSTFAYIIKEQFENLLSDQDWSLEEFMALHKDNFIREYHGFI